MYDANGKELLSTLVIPVLKKKTQWEDITNVPVPMSKKRALHMQNQKQKERAESE
jgi:hypothetical protein